MRRDYLKTHMKKIENEYFCASSLTASETYLNHESKSSSVSALNESIVSSSYEVSSTKEEELQKILKRND